ncbi:flavin reductase family protein [bacterium SCSIO 12643]|nr:flavin reductase family protein [bacterium SCSIO 12643]
MENFVQIDPKAENTPKIFGTMLGAIGPRPIAFASTVDKDGNPNLSPFSFFNGFGANPPIVVFSPSRRVRDNTTKHTLENVKATGEVVISVVNHAIVEQMSLSSTEYGLGVNEFIKSGLTPLESQLVKPLRVKESPVSMECKVVDIVELGTEGGAGNLVICEVVMFHIDPNVLDENGVIDQTKIDLVGRMGGDWYCRANGDALFEIEKPLRTLGIGVDQIPEDIRNSKILTGNDLGRLGNVEQLPSELDVNDYKLYELSEIFIEHEDNAAQLEEELHKIAKEHINNNQIELAWKTLLAFNDQ